MGSAAGIPKQQLLDRMSMETRTGRGTRCLPKRLAKSIHPSRTEIALLSPLTACNRHVRVRSLPQSDTWNEILDFHSKAANHRPSGKAGLKAINQIREILGEAFLPTGQHPLTQHLRMAYEPNYRWLIHYAQELEELTRIPGNKAVLQRLGASGTYQSAQVEMDFALKLRLAGCPCRFVLRSTDPTPDLLADIDGQDLEIEITSLNEPYEDRMSVDAMGTLLMVMSQFDCVGGGVWSRVPTLKELQLIKMG